MEFFAAFDRLLQAKTKKNEELPDESIVEELLEQSEAHCSSSLNYMNQEIEEMICECYNERILIEELTSHGFYSLLKTRNYFKLLWIEEPSTMRYQRFKERMAKSEFNNLCGWLQHSV